MKYDSEDFFDKPKNEFYDKKNKTLKKKNVILGTILTILFGPIGFLYVNILGGIIAIILSIVSAAHYGIIIIHPLLIIISPFALIRYNKALNIDLKSHQRNNKLNPVKTNTKATNK